MSKQIKKPLQKESFAQKIKKNRKLIMKSLILFAFVILLTALVSPLNRKPIDIYKVGDIANETIRAQKNMNILDEEKTENARREAERTVITIFDHDNTLVKTASQNIEESFEAMRKAHAETPNWNALYDQFTEIIGIDITKPEYMTLAKTGFSNMAAQRMIRVIEVLDGKLIVSDRSVLKPYANKGIYLRKIGSTDPSMDVYMADFSNIIELDNAVSLAKKRSDIVFRGYRPSSKRTIFGLIEKFIRPNIFVNMKLTTAKIEEARRMVKPITFSLQKNEVVVREGNRITKRQHEVLEGLRKARVETSTMQILIGLAFIILLVVFWTFKFAKSYIRKFDPKVRDLVFLLAATILTVVLAKLFIYLFSAIGGSFPSIPHDTYRFAIPVAASAMLVRFAINSETAIIFSFMISIIMGFLFGGDFNYAIYCFIGSVTGAYKVAHSETKFTLIKAGLLTGLINMLTAVSLLLISGKTFVSGPGLFVSTAFMGLLSGVFIAILLPTLSTLAEASGYLTDIKLIELANYNNPLLNKLALVAPGTYHHSRVVGQLVEVAAESIHANPLLAMVSAFYHDIGKIKQPEYFIENQTAENKHDDLKPSMSKMIIISHVKDGSDMGREAKLPPEIIDSIEQHHGTSLMHFFYKKAKDQENPDVDAVDESEYRYPGPKPQTREIGLLMLADAVEAATKSLTDPTPAQIQGMIQKVFNKTFTDGQLEDCEITLKDLHLIAASFFRVLVSIYKARIDYPDIPQKEGQKKKQNGDTGPKQAEEDKDKAVPAQEDNKGTLKRIGIDKK